VHGLRDFGPVELLKIAKVGGALGDLIKPISARLNHDRRMLVNVGSSVIGDAL
jgi:hypothetical protein